MAAATQLPFVSLTHSPVPEKRKRAPVERGRRMDDVLQQSAYLAKAVPEYLLNEEGIRINGFKSIPKGTFPEPPRWECLKTETFLTARSNLVAGCNYIKRQHGKELEEMCAKLDMSDEQLYPNFRTLLSTVWTEPVNWGRLVSLFAVTSVLSARLYREGQQSKIDSVLGWFGTFLKDHAAPWIRERGGWVSGSLPVRYVRAIPAMALESG